MTDDASRASVDARLDDLEARLEANRADLRTVRDRLETGDEPPDDRDGWDNRTGDPALSRRRMLTGLGVVGLLGFGTGTASAATGQIGTTSDPLVAVYTDELNGPVTDDKSVTGITGNVLQLDGNTLKSPWVDSDGDGLLELDGALTSYTGIDVPTVEPGHLDVKHTLQAYSDVGNDATRTSDALSMLFSETAWTDGNYRSGPAHNTVDDAFTGAVMTHTGEVVLVPSHASEVGRYDPTDDTYAAGNFSTPSTTPYFIGAALAATGEVVFAPTNADNVGVYDPSADSYTSGPSHGETTPAFRGATLAATGAVVFAPFDSSNVGVYDPSADSYTSGASHNEGSQAFRGATLTRTGEVVFAPRDSSNVGVYDPSADSYTSGASHGEGSRAFSAATPTPTGEVVFSPYDSNSVGKYDPSTDTYTSGASHGEGSKAFRGAVLSPTGEVVLVPAESSNVGVYDPANDSYTSGPSHGEGADAFTGGALTPSGKVVFGANDSNNVGVYDTFAQTDNPRSTALHPLVNST